MIRLSFKPEADKQHSFDVDLHHDMTAGWCWFDGQPPKACRSAAFGGAVTSQPVSKNDKGLTSGSTEGQTFSAPDRVRPSSYLEFPPANAAERFVQSVRRIEAYRRDSPESHRIDSDAGS